MLCSSLSNFVVLKIEEDGGETIYECAALEENGYDDRLVLAPIAEDQRGQISAKTEVKLFYIRMQNCCCSYQLTFALPFFFCIL